MHRVLVPIADGSEEMEVVIIIDTLRRAKWEVVSAGLREGVVTASRGVQLVPDAVWADINPDEFDVIIIPGGAGGVDKLRKDQRVLDAVKRFASQRKTIAAVCAGPLVLLDAGVLTGCRCTSHPAVAEDLMGVIRIDERVVTDGEIITSQGPGTTMAFALHILRHKGEDELAESIARGMVMPCG